MKLIPTIVVALLIGIGCVAATGSSSTPPPPSATGPVTLDDIDFQIKITKEAIEKYKNQAYLFDVVSVDEYFTRTGKVISGKQFQECRLPDARFADERDRFARFNFKRHMFEYRLSAFVSERNILEFDASIYSAENRRILRNIFFRFDAQESFNANE